MIASATPSSPNGPPPEFCSGRPALAGCGGTIAFVATRVEQRKKGDEFPHFESTAGGGLAALDR